MAARKPHIYSQNLLHFNTMECIEEYLRIDVTGNHNKAIKVLLQC